MEIFVAFVAFLTMVNTFLLVAVVISVSKLIRYLVEDEEHPSLKRSEKLVDLPSGPLYRMLDGELVQISAPTYDAAVLTGKAEPHADGLERRPKNSNWDGMT